MATDYSEEDFDQDLQQDIAAAAAQSAGVNMDSYDFGGFDSSGSDVTGASNQGVIDSIVGSYMDNPARTGMAIRQSFPMFNSPESGLNKFANLYTAQRGPLSRGAFNSMYDITRSNPGGINTLGYDTVKALQRLGFGPGTISTNPNVGKLSGEVYSRKNDKGETILMEGGKSAGIDANTFYSGKSSSDLVGGDLFDTYYDKYQYADPAARAEARRYDQYMNPYNQTGTMENPTGPPQPGFNPDPDVDPASLRGQVRPGLQSGIFSDKSGTPTQFGPIATYDRNFSGMDNTAMTLAPGGIGMLARALTNKVTGIAGQPLPQDAMAPTPEMVARGETYGGFGRSFSQIPGQIKQGLTDAGASIRNVIDDFTTPNVPAPVATSSLDFMPRGASPDLAGFENRFSQHPLTGEKTAPALGSVFEVDGRSFIAGKNGPIELSGVSLPNLRSENPAEATIDKGQGKILGVQDYLQNQFAAPADQFYTLNDKMNEGLSGEIYDAQPDTLLGIQNTGLFGEDRRTAGFRDLEGMIKSVVDGENFPDDQNMYGPGMPNQTPLTPDELNNLLEPYGMKLGRGPSSGGIMQLAV